MANEDEIYEDQVFEDEPSPLQSKLLPIAVLVALAALIGLTVYLFLEVRSVKADLAAQTQLHQEQFAQIEGVVNRASREADDRAQELRGAVASAEKGLSATARKVEQRVLGRTQVLAKKLDEQKVEHQSALTQVDGKVSQLSRVTADTDSRVGSLTGTVEGVQQDVAKNRQEIEQTVRELKTVRGDLGVQSGLIATNGTELNALRELGERNYYDFDITKAKQPQRVGAIQVRLRKTDRKRNKYTIELWADDKRIEKKNKTLLEPVQFYVLGSRIPYEIVVQKVEKNRIVGYLATPKVAARRSAASSAGSS